MADASGLDSDGRADLLVAIDDAIDRIEASALHSFASGDPAALAIIDRTGGIAKYDRRRRRWNDQRDRFAAVLA